MPDLYRIDVSFDIPLGRAVTKRWLRELAASVLAAEGVAGPAELSIAIVDDGAIRRLNAQYAGLDEPTDVLSFSQEEGEEPFVTPGKRRHLGDIAISYPTAQRQAQEQGHSIQHEMAHLLIHGILHILGYDHVQFYQEQAMRAREEALLAGLEHSDG